MAQLDDGPADLTVATVFEGDDTAVICIAGEIDIATADTIRAVVSAAVARRPVHIVFDLAAVTFIDSAGIASLIEARAVARSVHVRDPSAAVRRIIETTGLTVVLPAER